MRARRGARGVRQARVRTPRRTDSVWMEARLSPLTSGMSLKKAMTTEKTDMNALANSSGKVSVGSLSGGEACVRPASAARTGQHTQAACQAPA